MNKEEYDLCAAEIEKVQNAVTPNVPIRVLIQEAEDLCLWCQKDKAALTAAGLSWNLVESIPARIGALRYVQSEWLQSTDEAKAEWKERSPEAYALHDELIHHCMFAYRNMPDVLVKVQHIAEGAGHADMIQDLSDLSVLGKANSAPLVAIGVDMKLFDRAEVLSGEMGELLARANGARRETNVNVEIRNKAYAYLKEGMDEVRRCGQYVFWRDEKRKVGYVSMYIKAKMDKKKTSQAE
jgi:hypothetical protein